MAEAQFSFVEQKAFEATTLPAFQINLTKVRDQVRLVLTEWKSSGVFQEYTDHSFAHVEDMLEYSKWLIPDETKAAMTPADWLLLTLSIYFHDVGLLVTSDEYNRRANNAEFKSFLLNPILSSEKQSELDARLKDMDPGEVDRLQYQEFVRATHGKRIRRWIEGLPLDDAGASSIAGRIVHELLQPLDDDFRRDLASICESHTLNHVDAIANLPVSQPYGGPEETANLVYVAVILRTVDLLQITRRRAPTVLYQILNPSNPNSQLEWQKQTAVKTVRPAQPRDRDGNVTEDGVSTSIEVFATFKEPAGFFALTTYLSYAQKELSLSYNLIQKAKKDTIKPYSFPWRDIDVSGVKAIGFMTESFEFALDQHKILDLLTGHTLYNNTRVVLRELTQNALDAVRLQSAIEGESSESSKGVTISWDSKSRILEILDFGTGMTQEVIENHLLTVGSSRYQDRKFRDKFPKFHSISRFGIGVLSAFMVSDDVEITTCSPDQEPARRIALQSVHGKYLIKLLDKVANRAELPMFPHGTMVRLRLRSNADIGDVLAVARSWIAFPRCPVTVKIDEQGPVRIGFDSPKQAVEAYLHGMRKRDPKAEYKVEQLEEGGVQLAFALTRSSLFGDWSFVHPSRVRYHGEEEVGIGHATCIEGVAVQATTPGYDNASILAIANAVGPSAPKTNVARSALEDTKEQRDMLAAVYRMYAKHITDEIASLAKSDSYSLSRAVSIAPYIASPLLTQSNTATKKELLQNALGGIPMVLIEQGNQRRAISLSELESLNEFVTVEAPLYRSIEYFVREAPSDITAQHLLGVLGNRTTNRGEKPVVCNMTSFFLEEAIRGKYEIAKVMASNTERNVLLTWERKNSSSRWMSSSQLYRKFVKTDPIFSAQISDAMERLRSTSRYDVDRGLNCPMQNVTTDGLEGFGSFIAARERFIVPGTPLALYLNSKAEEDDVNVDKILASHFVFLETCRAYGASWDLISPEIMTRIFSNVQMLPFRDFIGDVKSFALAIEATGSSTFDTYAWERRSSDFIGEYM